MPYHLILILVPLVLLALFMALVAHEERVGRRILLPGSRYHFDTKVARAVFVVKHVDWGAFLNDLTRTSAERLVHDVAHSTLLAVRFAERHLTRLVRALRARRDEPMLPMHEDKPSRLQSAVTLVQKTVRRSRKQPKQLEASQEAE